MLKKSMLACALLAAVAPAWAQPKPGVAGAAIPDIPFEKFVLPNGLTVVVHEDHKAPIVAVNVWYHVGSKNEKRGKTGFAHLFEHLMFNGSEHYNDDYFKALEKVGATDLNGTTNQDRTNYFENVPKSALDLALFMESDRMGHLLGAIDQAKLDEQRGVVQNEKRQGENQPYGQVYNLLTENAYPAGHPYSWTVIGSMEDLNAASLDDVKEWFKGYYGPNNAVIAIAGDVTVAEAKAKVEKYFGDIPPGPPLARPTEWIAKRAGTKRLVLQDRVPQARLYMAWAVPPRTSGETTLLDVASDVLSSGKSSRLYKRLVYDDQIATDVGAGIQGGEIASQFLITATVKPGGDIGAVEKAVREELARFLRDGPTADEIERVQIQQRAGFVRGIERVGGFGGKSDILAMNAVYAGDPGFYKTVLARVAAAAPAEVRKAAVAWLSDGDLALEVQPFAKNEAKGPGADRAAVPQAPRPSDPKLPVTEEARLTNGLRVIVARREGVPVVNFDLIVDAGYAADASAPGTATFATNMMDEGTAAMNAIQISDELERLGADLGTGATLDSCRVNLSVLRDKLDPALALFADVVLHPSYPQEELDRQRKRALATIAREKVSPNSMGLRLLPGLLYGAGHPYGVPFTGSGTEAVVSALTREKLVAFHDQWFRPNNATLIVVGDTSLAEIKPRIEKLFASWKQAPVPKKALATVPPKAKAELYLVDRPGSQQSVIFAGVLAPPTNNPDAVALDAVEDLLGGSFTSRLNMNLREDKHWSYGAGMVMPDAKGQRPYFVMAPVQGDKTKEAVAEVVKELTGIVGTKPITADELAKAQGNLTLTLSGRWETNRAVSGSLAQIVQYGLPADYYDKFPERVRQLQLPAADAIAKKVILPDRFVYVVVGDRAKIEEGVRALGMGEPKIIDVDGKPVAMAKP